MVKPKIVYSGHKYLGPGNELNAGNPVDTDDAIAEIHDHGYNEAKNDNEVRSEDDIAIDSFLHDFIANGNPHSYLGAIGLGAKRVLETGTGVLYPASKKAKMDRPWWENEEPYPYKVKKPKLTVSPDDMGETYDRLGHANPWFSDNTIPEVTLPKRKNAHHSVKKDLAPADEAPNNGGEEDFVPEQPHLPPGIGDEADEGGFEGQFDSDEIFAHDDLAEDWEDHYGNANEPPSGEDISDPHNPGTGGAHTIDMSGAGGGASPQAAMQFKALGFSHRNGKFFYHNSMRVRTFGNVDYLHKPANVGTTHYNYTVVKSLVDLPTDKLSFYMPYSMVVSLPLGARVTRVGCSVTPIGVSVSFDTNASVTSSAATQHVLYGSAEVGLNLKFPTQRYTISRNPTAPMTLSGAVLGVNDNVWASRIWGSAPTNGAPAECAANNNIIIPHTYLGIIQPDITQTNNRQITISNQVSQWPFNQHIAIKPMAQQIGKRMIQWAYPLPEPIHIRGRRKYINGLIDTHRCADGGDPFLNNVRKTINNNTTAIGAATFQPLVPEPGVGAPTNVELSYSVGNTQITTTQYNDMRLYRHGSSPDHDATGKKTMAIPSINFGIEAVAANTPENVAAYINASCDWYVETFIECDIDYKLADWNYGDGTVVMDCHVNSAPLALNAVDNVPIVFKEVTFQTGPAVSGEVTPVQKKTRLN